MPAKRKKSYVADDAEADGGGGGSGGGGVDLMHRSRGEMLAVVSLAFPVDLSHVILDYMVNYRLLALHDVTVYRFRAVWYNLFWDGANENANECGDDASGLTPLISRVHLSKVKPELGPVPMARKRRTNRSSEPKTSRTRNQNQKKSPNVLARNFQRLIDTHLNCELNNSEGGLAVLCFENLQLSLRDIKNLDRTYPLTVQQESDLSQLQKALVDLGVEANTLLILSDQRLIGIRNVRDGFAVWDRAAHKFIWSDRFFGLGPAHKYNRNYFLPRLVSHKKQYYIVGVSSNNCLQVLKCRPKPFPPQPPPTAPMVPNTAHVPNTSLTAMADDKSNGGATIGAVAAVDLKSSDDIRVRCASGVMYVDARNEANFSDAASSNEFDLLSSWERLEHTIKYFEKGWDFCLGHVWTVTRANWRYADQSHVDQGDETGESGSQPVVMSKRPAKSFAMHYTDGGTEGEPLLVLRRISTRNESPMTRQESLHLYHLVSATCVDQVNDLETVLGFPPVDPAILQSWRRGRPNRYSPHYTTLKVYRWGSTVYAVGFRPNIHKLKVQTFRWIDAHSTFPPTPPSSASSSAAAAAATGPSASTVCVTRISPVDSWFDLSSAIKRHCEKHPMTDWDPVDRNIFEPEKKRFHLSGVTTIQAGRFIHVRLCDLAACRKKTHETHASDLSIDLCLDLEHTRTHYLGDLGSFHSISVCPTF